MPGFDEAFRTLFISNSAKLSLKNSNLNIVNDNSKASFSLKDIIAIILESKQITLTSALLSAIANAKVVVITCDDSHIPNGIFCSYLGHYQNAGILREQIALSAHKKAILWQQIIKQKVKNQANVLLKTNPKTAQKFLTYKN